MGKTIEEQREIIRIKNREEEITRMAGILKRYSPLEFSSMREVLKADPEIIRLAKNKGVWLVDRQYKLFSQDNRITIEQILNRQKV